MSGMDYKNQSSRDNEEERNADAAARGAVGTTPATAASLKTLLPDVRCDPRESSTRGYIIICGSDGWRAKQPNTASNAGVGEQEPGPTAPCRYLVGRFPSVIKHSKEPGWRREETRPRRCCRLAQPLKHYEHIKSVALKVRNQ